MNTSSDKCEGSDHPSYNNSKNLSNKIFSINQFVNSEICNLNRLDRVVYYFEQIELFNNGQKIPVKTKLIDYLKLFDEDQSISVGAYKCKYKQLSYNNFGEFGRSFAYKNKINLKESKINGQTDEDISFCPSLQSIKREVRNFICSEFCLDIDIKNCQPTILDQLIKFNGLNCPNLTEYVNNRDQILKKYNMTKDQVITIIYDSNKKCNIDFFDEINRYVYNEFLNTLKANPDYSRFYLNREKHARNIKNFKGSFISLILQDIENKILYYALEQMHDDGIDICCPMFDGAIVRKHNLIDDDYLQKINKIVKINTGYDVKFIVKDMKYPEEFDQLETKIPEKFRESLRTNVFKEEALQFLKRKDLIVHDGDKIWVKYFDNSWICETKKVEEMLVKYLSDTTTILVTQFPSIIKLIRAHAGDFVLDKNFRETLFNKDRIFFSNGCYSFEDDKFYDWDEIDQKGWKTNVVLDYKYHKNNEKIQKIIDEIYELILLPTFDHNKELLADFLSLNMRYLAGYYEDKYWGLAMGDRNSGKGTITDLFKKSFQSYVGTFETSNLCVADNSSDAEYGNKWLIEFDNKRIMFGNEIPDDKTLNGKIIKQIASGGDEVKARKAYENISSIRMRSLMWLFGNDIPDFPKRSRDCLNNCLYFTFPCVFSDNENAQSSTIYKVCKTAPVKEFVQNTKYIEIAMFHLMKSYYKKTKPGYIYLKQETLTISNESIDYMNVLTNMLEITKNEDDFLPIGDLTSSLKNKHEFTMSTAKLKEILKKGFGLEYIKYNKKPYRDKYGFKGVILI